MAKKKQGNKNGQGSINVNVNVNNNLQNGSSADTPQKKDDHEGIIVAIIGGVFAVIVALVALIPDVIPWPPWPGPEPPDIEYDLEPSEPIESTEPIPVVYQNGVPGHYEYRYWRWSTAYGDVSCDVNWCKEYGESINEKAYHQQYTVWFTTPAQFDGTWQCGHTDREHTSHIHSVGLNEAKTFPVWNRYIVSGYKNPNFYWEEVRWVQNQPDDSIEIIEPSETIESTEPAPIVYQNGVAGHNEYRYWRWSNAYRDVSCDVNWCKEYGESINGKTYHQQMTVWFTTPAQFDGTWQCGHTDREHTSHIHSVGLNEAKTFPVWNRYIVNGYKNPNFYWEEVRWVPNE